MKTGIVGFKAPPSVGKENIDIPTNRETIYSIEVQGTQVLMKTVICDVAGCGLGLLALEPLQPGQVLVREKPVIEVDTGASNLDRREVALCYREEDREAQGERREFKKLAKAFVALSKEEKCKVLALTRIETIRENSLLLAWEDLVKENIDLDYDQFRRLIQIYLTNAFSDGLWPDLARVNHSCFPNAEVVRRGKQRMLVVVRPIERGEEVTHSYLHSLMGKEARQEVLKTRWGFLCTCMLCSLPEPTRAEQERQRAHFRAADTIWKQQRSSTALEEAVGLADTVLGFRKMDKLRLLSSLCISRPSPGVNKVGADISLLLLGEESEETKLWSWRRDRPMTSKIVSLLANILTSIWAVLTLAVISYNFWQGYTTPYCLLLLTATLYSKSL